MTELVLREVLKSPAQPVVNLDGAAGRVEIDGSTPDDWSLWLLLLWLLSLLLFMLRVPSCPAAVDSIGPIDTDDDDVDLGNTHRTLFYRTGDISF